MEKENLFILQVPMKESSKTFLNKVLERRLFQMEIFFLANTEMESQMVKENMNGKMELTMKGISSKGLETV